MKRKILPIGVLFISATLGVMLNVLDQPMQKNKLLERQSQSQQTSIWNEQNFDLKSLELREERQFLIPNEDSDGSLILIFPDNNKSDEFMML